MAPNALNQYPCRKHAFDKGRCVLCGANDWEVKWLSVWFYSTETKTPSVE